MILETQRLILRHLGLDDFDIFFQLDSDPAVMRYIGPPLTEKQSRERLEKAIQKYTTRSGLGRWMAVLKDDGESIGWYILDHLEESGMIEVGYRLLQKHWGKGYATEMSIALLRYGFFNLGLEKIVGITNSENTASQRVLKKIGMQHAGEEYHYKQKVSLFEITNPYILSNIE